jgi:hypothetical protein
MRTRFMVKVSADHFAIAHYLVLPTTVFTYNLWTITSLWYCQFYDKLDRIYWLICSRISRFHHFTHH